MFFIQVSFIWLLQQSLQRLAVVPNLNKVGQTWRLQQRSFPSICCSRTTWVSFAEIPIQLNLSRPCPFLALGPVGPQQSRPSHLFTIPSAEFPASCAFVQWCLCFYTTLPGFLQTGNASHKIRPFYNLACTYTWISMHIICLCVVCIWMCVFVITCLCIHHVYVWHNYCVCIYVHDCRE